ncbi:hypothetical protein BU23DRAFT_446926 [Bimuria novae-zelandiae CBS 107.79]|uniref:Uncharacterized protein n=1 Tax=Bimuria novae-zelandiae CBS 107.79 TaxID=1447943 RepID=A0A6A5VQJ6_9PLEO|nr:hypothetical protein BU23DRAFT_446926 [Bimuria novae-zelandiae CBS 107.79]
MPPLAGFSDNPLRSRLDLVKAAVALIKPLEPYKSASGARIKLATSTGAGFSETAAQLEGFSRPLWVVASLLRLKSTTSDPAIRTLLSDVNLDSWIRGLKEGTDPQSPEYWGDLSSFDQRMVEMETIAFALLLNPLAFSFADDAPARENLVRWLLQINAHAMPQNNWLWFRVLVNLALICSLGVPLDEVRTHIDDALKELDTFYLGEGWSSDGLWGEMRKQADYYSGSFAMQFAQCLFVRFAVSLPEYASRIDRYRDQAREFASEYWRYFDTDGAAIPFGRSLTYRFAFAAFWDAVAFANVPLPAHLSPGAVKGLLLRHLRWWTKQPHIFNTDGTQNIGYCYANMYMAEDYNSPQSVYWCLKSFLAIDLEEQCTFWANEEEAHPLAIERTGSIERVKLIASPRHLMASTEEHHFLLSSGQSTTKRFKARDAKYAKFAYSSAFGLSVPCGPFLEQIAPDSTLAVSLDDGEEDWKVRWEPSDVKSGFMHIIGREGLSESEGVLSPSTSGSEAVPTLTSTWKPWRTQQIEVQTTLVAPMQQWPGWHLRVHRVRVPKLTITAWPLRFVDSGFAISSQTTQGASVFEQSVHPTFEELGSTEQGWWNDGKGSLVISEAGASGAADLTDSFLKFESKGESIIIRADPNTNIVAQRTLIPAAQHVFTADSGATPCAGDDSAGDDSAGDGIVEFWVVTGIFAIQASAKNYMDRVWELWRNKPTIPMVQKWTDACKCWGFDYARCSFDAESVSS